MGGGGSHQRGGDLGVDVVERVGGLVEVVERDGVADEIGARMDGGAQVAVIETVDGVARLVGDVLMPARSEADDDDAWRPGRGCGFSGVRHRRAR